MKIAELRKMAGTSGYWGCFAPEKDREIYEAIECTLDCEGVQVSSDFEEGGRWSNYETKVYRFKEGEEVAFFELMREVPATESQDGGDHTFEFYEVKPKEVKITRYERV